jgi:hypothetical protein
LLYECIQRSYPTNCSFSGYHLIIELNCKIHIYISYDKPVLFYLYDLYRLTKSLDRVNGLKKSTYE